MDFKDTYPDYVPIEEHIRRARIERSLALAQMFAAAAAGIGRGIGKLVAACAGLKGEPALILPKEAPHR